MAEWGNGFLVRKMRRWEVARAVDWAAAEGWNPGLADAECFVTANPDGFLLGEQDDPLACTISLIFGPAQRVQSRFSSRSSSPRASRIARNSCGSSASAR
jgi:hypothetical protein